MTVFSPPITPTIYDRGREQYGSEIRKVEYGDWTIIPSEIADAYNVTPYANDMIVYHGDVGEVYIADEHAHVADSMYRSHPVIFIQEFVATAVMHCKRQGVIGGLKCTDDRCVYRDE